MDSTYCPDGQSGAPLGFQDVQTDPTEFVNVRMEDLGPKQEFWGLQRVALGQVELCGKHSALIWGPLGPC